jgi:superfamily II DNA/RNA helicase
MRYRNTLTIQLALFVTPVRTFRLCNYFSASRSLHRSVSEYCQNSHDRNVLNIVENNDASYLFGDKPTSYANTGVSVELSNAVLKAGKHIPTLIQDASFKTIVNGSDTLIASETGSGKTLAYLMPLIEQIMQNRITKTDDSNITSVVILVPNKELCVQVQDVATQLLNNLSYSSQYQITSGRSHIYHYYYYYYFILHLYL